MIFYDGHETREYTKTCRDFEYTGVKCCSTCHDISERELDIIIIDGSPCLVCCQFRAFFYPPKVDPRDTPAEKLLRVIFGETPHEQPND